MVVRLQPAARRNGIDGVLQLDNGARVLKARVSAVPEKGEANAALVKLLAKAWRLPKSSLELLAGQNDRRKTLMVAGAGAERLKALQEWLNRLESPEKA